MLTLPPADLNPGMLGLVSVKVFLRKMAAIGSIINVNSVNLLKFSALGFGVWYGINRHQYLTKFVEERHQQQERQKYEFLVEEGKVAYQAQVMRELAEKAKLDNVSLDFDSVYFNGEDFINWMAENNK